MSGWILTKCKSFNREPWQTEEETDPHNFEWVECLLNITTGALIFECTNDTVDFMTPNGRTAEFEGSFEHYKIMLLTPVWPE